MYLPPPHPQLVYGRIAGPRESSAFLASAAEPPHYHPLKFLGRLIICWRCHGRASALARANHADRRASRRAALRARRGCFGPITCGIRKLAPPGPSVHLHAGRVWVWNDHRLGAPLHIGASTRASPRPSRCTALPPPHGTQPRPRQRCPNVCAPTRPPRTAVAFGTPVTLPLALPPPGGACLGGSAGGG